MIQYEQKPAPKSAFEHDGICETDRPVPGWWKWIFVSTIVIAPIYAVYFHAGVPGRSMADQLQQNVAENLRRQYAEIGDLEGDQATMVRMLQEPKWVGVGKSIFKANCVSCHGLEGGGLVGPNLCDDNYKHIKELPDILKVLNEGLAGGAMPAWGKRFSHKNDLVLLAVYVASLRGSKPAGGKGPDGSPIAAWPSE
jgi:cytochrome c oxidase cbb3-type subunit III